MSTWTETTLGKLISGTSGSIKTGPFGTALKASEYSTSGVPIISVGEVCYGSLRLRKDTPLAPEAVTNRLSEYVLNEGDIVFGRKGAVDRSAWVKPEENGWFLGSDGIRLRLPLTIHSRFLSYQFQTELTKTWLLQHSAGSTMLSLNQKVLERVPIRIPALQEQRGIAEILGALDDKIAANTKLAAKLAEMATAQFDLASINANDLHPLSDLVSTQYGLTTSAHDGEGPRFLRVTDINKKPWVEWDSTPNCTVTDTEWAKYRVEASDILVARMADPGKAALIDDSDPDAVFASYLVRLKPLNPKHALYIYYFLRSDVYQNYANGVSAGSVQKNMNAKVIVNTDISLPPEDVLITFSESAAMLRKNIQSVLSENQTLAATRDALLPRLMSGNLRVKDTTRIVKGKV